VYPLFQKPNDTAKLKSASIDTIAIIGISIENLRSSHHQTTGCQSMLLFTVFLHGQIMAEVSKTDYDDDSHTDVNQLL